MYYNKRDSNIAYVIIKTFRVQNKEGIHQSDDIFLIILFKNLHYSYHFSEYTQILQKNDTIIQNDFWSGIRLQNPKEKELAIIYDNTKSTFDHSVLKLPILQC